MRRNNDSDVLFDDAPVRRELGDVLGGQLVKEIHVGETVAQTDVVLCVLELRKSIERD